MVSNCSFRNITRFPGIAKCDRLLLQSASSIAKCGSCYKVRRNSPNKTVQKVKLSTEFLYNKFEQTENFLRTFFRFNKEIFTGKLGFCAVALILPVCTWTFPRRSKKNITENFYDCSMTVYNVS